MHRAGQWIPATMVGWFANAMEVGAQDFTSRCKVTAHQDENGTISLVDDGLALPDEVLISTKLLMEMIDRHNERRHSCRTCFLGRELRGGVPRGAG